MTKQEFEERINATISPLDYSVIEYVYMFHPAISETNGKNQIAKIYEIGGMRLIKDMVSTAKTGDRLDSEIMKAKARLDYLNDLRQDFLNGKDISIDD